MSPLVWLTLRTYRNVLASRVRTLWRPTRLLTLGVVLSGLFYLARKRSQLELTLRSYAPRGAAALAGEVAAGSNVTEDPSQQLLRGLAIVREDDATMGLVLALCLFLISTVAWLNPVVENPLELTEAEAATLLPAPLPRWHVVVYKVARWQVPLLFHSLVLSVVFGGPSDVARNVRSALAIWIVVAAWRTHRGLVGIVRATWAVKGSALFPLLGLILAAAAVGFAAVSGGRSVGDQLLVDVVFALPRLAHDRTVQLVLLPWLALTAPVVRSGDAEAWTGAMPVALAGLSAVVFLVVRADRAFAHATTSAERAIEDPARAARTIFRPGPAGSPALAVAFRQLAPFLRVRWLTGRVLGVLGVVVAGVLLPRETSSIVAALPVSVLGFATAFMMLFGPLVVRLDVRREIERLDVLRALPLRGEHVLLAVGAAGIIATSTVQATLLLALSVLLPVRAPAVVRAFSVLLLTWPMVTSLGVAVCQLAALLFPTWVTPSNPRGPRIDAIGGRLVALLGYSGSVGLLVLPPAVAALSLLQTASALGATHLVGRIFFLLTFYFVGGLELWLLSRVSRWAFDRIE